MNIERFIARPMLLLHAVAGFAVLAISIHVLYFAFKGGRQRGTGHRAKTIRYMGITWPLYLAALITGAIAYPAYKIDVREAYLDAHQPLLTGLFEVKEHWGAIGLLLAWALWRYYRRSARADIANTDLTFWRGQTLLVLLMVLCILANALVGVWITMVQSV